DTYEGYIFITARVFLEGTPVMGTYGFHYCPGVLGGDTYDGAAKMGTLLQQEKRKMVASAFGEAQGGSSALCPIGLFSLIASVGVRMETLLIISPFVFRVVVRRFLYDDSLLSDLLWLLASLAGLAVNWFNMVANDEDEDVDLCSAIPSDHDMSMTSMP
ncbi:hypothetical protein Tco_0796872, partial [Tanacetum coccineum]